MTHRTSTVARALELRAGGRSATEVARLTGVPRRTVVDWLAGRTPRERTAVSFENLPLAYVHLLGLYLGDGAISEHPRGVYRLRVVLDVRYPGIIDEAAASMQAVLPGNAVGKVTRQSNCVEVYAYSKTWPELLPQHGPGKKHERAIALEDWQQRLVAQAPELLLRGLVQSDGCRFINTGKRWRHPRYSFSNRSEDILRIFCHGCDLLGLRYTFAPRTVYVSRKADVARMDEFIGPKA
jgi:hypothetical protein